MGIGDGDTMKVDNAVSFQSTRCSPTDIPDVCKQPVVPHSFHKGFFIKINYMVRLMLRLHIQRSMTRGILNFFMFLLQ
jgi:hypothetical protein